MNHEDRLYALVREIESNVARVEEAVRQANQEEFRRPVLGSLGSVVANGAGEIVSVDLDPRALRTTTGRVLGERVCQAIRQAEAAAASACEDRIRAAKRRISL